MVGCSPGALRSAWQGHAPDDLVETDSHKMVSAARLKLSPRALSGLAALWRQPDPDPDPNRQEIGVGGVFVLHVVIDGSPGRYNPRRTS